MKVFLTGATGFVGAKVLGQLQAAGHQVRCLVRHRSLGKFKPANGIEICQGDVLESLAGKLDGCEAVIHLAGSTREIPFQGITFERLQFEGTKNVVDEANRARIARFILMSALGASPQAPSRYQQTKYYADKYLMDSGLRYTIFRPPMIYGPQDQSINIFVKLIKLIPVIPIVGLGKCKQQFVAVETVAEGMVLALSHSRYENKIYEVAGPELLSFDEVLDIIGEILGKRVIKLHQPAFLLKPIVKLLWPIPVFPLNPDKLNMLLNNYPCDEKPCYRDFNISPIPFKEGLTKYLRK